MNVKRQKWSNCHTQQSVAERQWQHFPLNVCVHKRRQSSLQVCVSVCSVTAFSQWTVIINVAWQQLRKQQRPWGLLHLGSDKQDFALFSTVDFNFPSDTRAPKMRTATFSLYICWSFSSCDRSILSCSHSRLSLLWKRGRGWEEEEGRRFNVHSRSSASGCWTYIDVQLVWHVRVAVFPVVVWSHLSGREHSAQADSWDARVNITSHHRVEI